MNDVSKTIIPKNYKAKLNLYDTQKAISFIKKIFESYLTKNLNLKRVSAPLFVTTSSGLNDNLNNIERPVTFDALGLNENVEIIHSLAKWKRQALYRYNFIPYNGLYTDMNAIRRDEILDNTHSIYVDQWDWEKVIKDEDRNLEYLKEEVLKIHEAIYKTSKDVNNKFNLDVNITKDIYFIKSEELLKMYPNLDSKMREYEITKKYKSVCIMQIGKILSNNEKHDNRAPDYDDWELNCDIIYYHELLDIALELSSMGIRVNSMSMLSQLKEANLLKRSDLLYHKNVIDNIYPLSIGGGIGQSRLSMLLLDKAHIGEVQVSIWDMETINKTKDKIVLL